MNTPNKSRSFLSGEFHLTRIVVLACAILAGCASTKVTNREVMVTEQIAKPANILVYDFAATADDIPDYSELSTQPFDPSGKPTPEQAELGRKLGTTIAQELAQEIVKMGLPAQRVPLAAVPNEGDLLIRGYLVSVDEGSTTKRVALGFGYGSSELKTVVEGFQMTASGPRKLGTGSLDSGGAKSPGGALGAGMLLLTRNPLGLIVSSGVNVYGETTGEATVEGRAKQTAKEIANQLKVRFEQQGWIK